MRHAMGIAVFSGMLGVTFFGLMLTPLFYVLVRKLSRRAHLANAGGGAPLVLEHRKLGDETG
jgi:multidrug efflux pump